MAEEEKGFTAKFENIELANLTHDVVSLARCDIVKMEEQCKYIDYIALCKKERRYLYLVLDTAIKKLEE